ncbi:aminotransferase-like protein [Suhomyces tanzawaensis NRRL Y-17324]|uniref:Aminotransferase-like protein n=1 Tax=Suhomyces tanzawaensis NRRL Y-17324 TaxID=984487 RepID=A0A1E4SFX5_9ASCO|nr:aminotransferase-like protein [Suhomyces tanzawaensis NRRL Y-17324]ODV78370.1 aminotransferase-like protein [Suhomyces tanzawaensis NRRL Y-17324]
MPITTPTIDPYADLLEQLEDKYTSQAFPKDPLSFEILSTIRYDPSLTQTATISKDHFFLYDEHYNRLSFALKYFYLQFHGTTEYPFEITSLFLLEKLTEAIVKSDKPTTQPYKLRLLVKLDSSVAIEVHDTPPRANLLDGLLDTTEPQWDVYVKRDPILISPFTSFKTTNRKVYSDARAFLPAKRPGHEEILLKNSHGHLMEGTITNVAVKRKSDGVWVTPQLSSGCLCGVTRHFLLRKNFIQEETIFMADLEPGAEILLFNGIMGVVRAKVIGEV